MDAQSLKAAAAGGAVAAVLTYFLTRKSGSAGAGAGAGSGAGGKGPSRPAVAVGEASTTDSGLVAAASGGANNVYETQKAVSEYLLFHFGKDSEVLPYPAGPTSALQFPKRTADLCAKYCKEAGVAPRRALDVGCAVGAASFHLAAHFDEVVGIDFSQAFVDAANKMKAVGSAPYTMVMEGSVTQECEAVVPAHLDRSRCTFLQGDACNLPSSLGRFSVIHAANLLCRLPDPAAFLDRLDSLLVPGGLVVLVSPYSWMPGYTPKEKWVGGFVEHGKAHMSAKGLTDLMESRFKQLDQDNVPFLIREHARKFQWGCSHLTVWQRR